MQASGTLHFQSLNEARAQRSLLYHKLEHEKLIHFIHLSENERERRKNLCCQVPHSKSVMLERGCWNGSVYRQTERALVQNSKAPAGCSRAVAGARIEFSSQITHSPPQTPQLFLCRDKMMPSRAMGKLSVAAGDFGWLRNQIVLLVFVLWV